MKHNEKVDKSLYDEFYDRTYKEAYDSGFRDCERKYIKIIEEGSVRVGKIEQLLKIFLNNKNACLCDHCMSERLKAQINKHE